MIRLFHVSDLHFGRADPEALDWFAHAVADERPDAIVVTGNLTMRARSAEYAAAGEWLSSLDVPLSIEPGNHDLPLYNPFRRFLSPYRRFGRIERALERPIDLPGMWLVPLRTTSRAQWRLNWALGKVSASSLRAAEARLVKKPPGAIGIIACHHPLVDREDIQAHAKTRGGREAVERLAAAGGDAVLSGHVHDPFDAELNAAGRSIRMIGAGTLSERVRGSRPSFNVLTIDRGLLRVNARSLP